MAKIKLVVDYLNDSLYVINTVSKEKKLVEIKDYLLVAGKLSLSDIVEDIQKTRKEKSSAFGKLFPQLGFQKDFLSYLYFTTSKQNKKAIYFEDNDNQFFPLPQTTKKIRI